MSTKLNRREFVTLLASASMTVRSAYAQAVGKPIVGGGDSLSALGSPTWVKEGVVAASNMESLSFVRRRGGQDENYEQQLLADLTEPTVKTLLQAGVNILILQFYKG